LKESDRWTLLVVAGRIVVSTTTATASTAAAPTAVDHGRVIRAVSAAQATAIISRWIIFTMTATPSIVTRLGMIPATANNR
jgi:hypothetical protein